MKQILLVTHDQAMLAMLADFLVARGFAVSAVSSINQAKTLFAEHPFEAVIVDLDFQDGLLQWDLKPVNEKLILLVPFGEDGQRLSTKHILEKPVKLGALEERINQILAIPK